MRWTALLILLWATQLDLMEQARHLEASGQQDEALVICLQVLQSHPESVEALTRASYLSGVIGSQSANEQVKRNDYDQSLQLAEKAYSLDPQDAEVNFVMAWALGGQALLAGSRQKVRLAYRMKEFLDRTLRLQPNHDRAWYLLGNWRTQVAGASMMERAVARMLLGGLPADATKKNAASAYAKAVELKPDSILYLFHYAQALAELDQRGQAEAFCRKALRLPPRTPDDNRLLLRSRVLLKSLK